MFLACQLMIAMFLYRLVHTLAIISERMDLSLDDCNDLHGLDCSTRPLAGDAEAGRWIIRMCC